MVQFYFTKESIEASFYWGLGEYQSPRVVIIIINMLIKQWDLVVDK